MIISGLTCFSVIREYAVYSLWNGMLCVWLCCSYITHTVNIITINTSTNKCNEDNTNTPVLKHVRV